MALDRQRILTELGSVVNQLQNADCGCMGKLFNNPGQNEHNPKGNFLPTCGGCRRGCCHGHGYGGWNSGGPCGDPYTMNNQQCMQRGDPYTMNNQQVMQRPCMGHCNPTKLYSDTYNYLTENLMQPTIKEVYNDLHNITPLNTIANNPMANQIVGLKDGFATQKNSGADNQYKAVPFSNMTNMSNNLGSMPNSELHGKKIEHMGGMGPQIMNMIGSNNVSNPSNIRSGIDQDGNRLTGPMVIDAPQSPHGAVGVTPLSAPIRNNEGIYATNNIIGYQNPNSIQYNNMTAANISNTTPNSQNMQGSQNISHINTNPAAQQMHHHGHGQHKQGISKFNEMFPGVIKGLGGDLNFDPMAMAIQMNPANYHKSTMETMQKILTNSNAGINRELDSATHANPTSEIPITGTTHNINNRTNVPQVHNANSEQFNNSNIIPSKSSNLYGAPTEKNQQVYTAVTQQPISQHGLMQQNMQVQPNMQQMSKEPNSRNAIPLPTLPTLYEGVLGNENELSKVTNSNTVSEVPDNQQNIKEPIFPADTSKFYVPKQKRYEYNTLGQPIEMLPAQMYHIREPALPQTLSPQPPQRPDNTARFSNVKSTISKTSLMGTRAINKTASRSQLQHIYNQYKGSQSNTQHNVKASDNGASSSDGKLNIPRTNLPVAQQNIPIERKGGDVLAHNQIQDQITNKVEEVMGQIGDVPHVNKPSGDITNTQVTDKKARNGLQDQVYTSYPTSAAWSFHGDGRPRYSSGYRNRYRI